MATEQVDFNGAVLHMRRVNHEHGGLHGFGAEPVQGFLAGLSDIGRVSVYRILEPPTYGVGIPIGGPE